MRAAHPLHPAIAHFPVALWLAAAAADGLWMFTGDAAWTAWSRTALLGGTLAGVVAVLAGGLELVLRRIPREAITTLVAHVGCMFVALTCCAASFALRRDGVPPPAALALSFTGGAAVALGGWFGGSLVYRFGLGSMASNKAL